MPGTADAEVQHVCQQVMERGYGVLRGVLDGQVVDAFVRQMDDYLEDATAPKSKKRCAEGGEVRAHDASYGRGERVSIHDAATWPRGGTRRVFECVPMGVGDHWGVMKGDRRLGACLDELLGEGCWEMPLNRAPAGGGGGEFVRHWYSPVVFPEGFEDLGGGKSNQQRHKGRGEGEPQPGAHPPADSGDGVGGGWRRAVLLSWKGEVEANGRLERGQAGGRWQPVNRRRFCSKGWHIDIGPGFGMQDVRTLNGDPRQGVVLLLLLSDWDPGCGGTAMVPYSHEWVRERLQLEVDAGREGMTHDDLNRWCQDRMRALTEEGKILIPTDGGEAQAPAGCYAIEQVVGKRGDLVVMHPWLVHSGTTNMGDRPRLMSNGMVKVTQEAFARHECVQVLRPRGEA